MPAATIHCTECGAALRVAARPDPGKKVKCPKCQEVFVVPPEEDVADRPAAKPAKARPNGAAPARVAAKPIPPRRAAEDEEDEAPRKPVKARRAAEEDEEAPRKPTKAKAAADDEDDEEGFVRRKPKRKSKKSKGSKTGMMLGVTVAVILLLVLLGGGAVTAFIWPGFLVSSENKGTGNEQPLAYIPSGHTKAVGFKPDALEQVGLLSQFENQNTTDRAFLDNLKKEAKLNLKDFEFVQQSEKPRTTLAPAMAAGGGAPPRQPAAGGGPPNQPPPPGGSASEHLLVLKTKAPFKAAEVLKAATEPQKKKYEGKIYFTMKSSGLEGATTLFMPSDRLIILSNMSEDQFQSVVACDGTPSRTTSSLAALLQGKENSSAWVVTTAADDLAGLTTMGSMNGQPDPNMPAPSALVLSADLNNSGLAVRVAAQFADTKTAEKASAELEKKIGMLGALLAMGGGNQAQDLKTLNLTTEGNDVVATCKISKATLDTIAQSARMGGPAGGPPRPPGPPQ